MNIDELSTALADIEKTLLVSKGQQDTLQARLQQLNDEIASSEESVDDLDLAIKFLTQTSKKARDNTIQNIEALATMSVQAVYDEPLEIKLQYKDKAKNDSSDKIKLRLIRQTDYGEVVTGLMNEVGGGVIETVSFSLRIACIKWLGYKGPIILDEAYKSLSNDEKLDRMATYLKELGKTVGNQIILLSHKEDVFKSIASKTFVVTNENSISSVEEC